MLEQEQVVPSISAQMEYFQTSPDCRLWAAKKIKISVDADEGVSLPKRAVGTAAFLEHISRLIIFMEKEENAQRVGRSLYENIKREQLAVNPQWNPVVDWIELVQNLVSVNHLTCWLNVLSALYKLLYETRDFDAKFEEVKIRILQLLIKNNQIEKLKDPLKFKVTQEVKKIQDEQLKKWEIFVYGKTSKSSLVDFDLLSDEYKKQALDFCEKFVFNEVKNAWNLARKFNIDNVNLLIENLNKSDPKKVEEFKLKIEFINKFISLTEVSSISSIFTEHWRKRISNFDEFIFRFIETLGLSYPRIHIMINALVYSDKVLTEFEKKNVFRLRELYCKAVSSLLSLKSNDNACKMLLSGPVFNLIKSFFLMLGEDDLRSFVSNIHNILDAEMKKRILARLDSNESSEKSMLGVFKENIFWKKRFHPNFESLDEKFLCDFDERYSKELKKLSADRFSVFLSEIASLDSKVGMLKKELELGQANWSAWLSLQKRKIAELIAKRYRLLEVYEKNPSEEVRKLLTDVDVGILKTRNERNKVLIKIVNKKLELSEATVISDLLYYYLDPDQNKDVRFRKILLERMAFQAGLHMEKGEAFPFKIIKLQGKVVIDTRKYLLDFIESKIEKIVMKDVVGIDLGDELNKLILCLSISQRSACLIRIAEKIPQNALGRRIYEKLLSSAMLTFFFGDNEILKKQVSEEIKSRIYQRSVFQQEKELASKIESYLTGPQSELPKLLILTEDFATKFSLYVPQSILLEWIRCSSVLCEDRDIVHDKIIHAFFLVMLSDHATCAFSIMSISNARMILKHQDLYFKSVNQISRIRILDLFQQNERGAIRQTFLVHLENLYKLIDFPGAKNKLSEVESQFFFSLSKIQLASKNKELLEFMKSMLYLFKKNKINESVETYIRTIYQLFVFELEKTVDEKFNLSEKKFELFQDIFRFYLPLISSFPEGILTTQLLAFVCENREKIFRSVMLSFKQANVPASELEKEVSTLWSLLPINSNERGRLLDECLSSSWPLLENAPFTQVFKVAPVGNETNVSRPLALQLAMQGIFAKKVLNFHDSAPTACPSNRH